MENMNFDFYDYDFLNMIEPENISASDFISKAKILLSVIEDNYSHSWKLMSIDECLSTGIVKKYGNCNNCVGKCDIIMDDVEYDCVANYSDDICYIRYFDNIDFSESISDIILTGKHSYHELLYSDVEKNKLDE